MRRAWHGSKTWYGGTVLGALLALGCLPAAVPRQAIPAPVATRNSAPGNAPAAPPLAALAPLPAEIRAVWLTHYEYMKGGESMWAAMADDLVRHGINTVYLAMYADARPLWNSEVFRRASGTALSEDWARRLIPVFRSRGLRVAAWFEYGLAVGGAESPLVRAHPDWLQRDALGNFVGHESGMVFLSPGVAAASTFVAALVEELVRNYEWDEIQIDRFRYTRGSPAGREFGYERGPLETFLESVHQKGLVPGKDEPAWVRFREIQVNTAVERAFRAAKSARPRIVVSSSPVGYYGITQHMQRWGDWLCGGYLDFSVPQIYEKTIEGFRNHFKMLADIAASCNRLDRFGAGVDASAPADADLVEEQLRFARSSGVKHASLWVYHTYAGSVSVRDNLDKMALPGHIWEAPAR